MENSPKGNSPENNPRGDKPRVIRSLSKEASKAFHEREKQRMLEEQKKNAEEAKTLTAMGDPFSILPIWVKEEYSYDDEACSTVTGLENYYSGLKLKTKAAKEGLVEHVASKNKNSGDENTYHAKGLEYAFVAVAGEEWLCPSDDCRLLAFPSSEYDDTCGNRIDAVVDLITSGSEHILFGIDLYSEDSKEKTGQTASEEKNRGWHRVKKILQSNNNPNFDGPIGYSKINSCPRDAEGKLTAGNAVIDEGTPDQSVLVPRFVVGIDRDAIDSLLRSFKNGQYALQERRAKGGEKLFHPFDHYAILQELICQAELFIKIQKESDSGKNADSIKLLEKLDTTFKQMRSSLYESMFNDNGANKGTQKAQLEQLLADRYPDDDKYDALSKLILKYQKDRVFEALTSVTSTLKECGPSKIDEMKAECKNRDHEKSYRAFARAAIEASGVAS